MMIITYLDRVYDVTTINFLGEEVNVIFTTPNGLRSVTMSEADFRASVRFDDRPKFTPRKVVIDWDGPRSAMVIRETEKTVALVWSDFTESEITREDFDELFIRNIEQ